MQLGNLNKTMAPHLIRMRLPYVVVVCIRACNSMSIPIEQMLRGEGNIVRKPSRCGYFLKQVTTIPLVWFSYNRLAKIRRQSHHCNYQTPQILNHGSIGCNWKLQRFSLYNWFTYKNCKLELKNKLCMSTSILSANKNKRQDKEIKRVQIDWIRSEFT